MLSVMYDRLSSGCTKGKVTWSQGKLLGRRDVKLRLEERKETWAARPGKRVALGDENEVQFTRLELSGREWLKVRPNR